MVFKILLYKRTDNERGNCYTVEKRTRINNDLLRWSYRVEGPILYRKKRRSQYKKVNALYNQCKKD